MCRDYSVGERGTGGRGQADVIGQKPVPVTLSTPQIRRTRRTETLSARLKRDFWLPP